MPKNNDERSAKAIDAYGTLTTYDDLFSTTNNPFLYIIRILGWWIIRGLASLVGGVESIVNDLMSHINFFESAEVTGFMSTIRPIIWSLLLIGIVVLDITFMFNQSERNTDSCQLAVFCPDHHGIAYFFVPDFRYHNNGHPDVLGFQFGQQSDSKILCAGFILL